MNLVNGWKGSLKFWQWQKMEVNLDTFDIKIKLSYLVKFEDDDQIKGPIH